MPLPKLNPRGVCLADGECDCGPLFTGEACDKFRGCPAKLNPAVCEALIESNAVTRAMAGTRRKASGTTPRVDDSESSNSSDQIILDDLDAKFWNNKASSQSKGRQPKAVDIFSATEGTQLPDGFGNFSGMSTDSAASSSAVTGESSSKSQSIAPEKPAADLATPSEDQTDTATDQPKTPDLSPKASLGADSPGRQQGAKQ